MTTFSPTPESATDSAPCTRLPLLPGERWWGGLVEDGPALPMRRTPYRRDLGRPKFHGSDAGMPSSQGAPVLVSTSGRVIASHRPFRIELDDDAIAAVGDDIVVHETGGSLRDAYAFASRHFFPPSGRAPAREMFTKPQYNTWIESPYRPTQESVLAYARRLLDAGLPPGVIMIDDSWAPDYGTWAFDPARFPDPRGMVAELNEHGFDVMLWVVPFVSPDSAAFRELEDEGLLLRDSSGRTAIRRWWNGFSAVLDLSNPSAVDWIAQRLDVLVNEVGVSGFKFDGGDVRDCHDDDQTFAPMEPVDFCEKWAELGLRYPFNEYRACWRMGGQPLAQRLADKPPSWGEMGISSLIPELLTQAMIGHAFTCPDMIGGGEIMAMSSVSEIDQEFFVRYAQLAAFSPMMQFSTSPARVLDEEHFAAVREALELRESLLPELERLIDEASSTGEPILRPMAYHAPELTDVVDQFYFGPNLIVAPVLTKAASSRAVALPAGLWKDAAGETHVGPAVVDVPCTLSTVPHFRRVAEAS